MVHFTVQIPALKLKVLSAKNRKTYSQMINTIADAYQKLDDLAGTHKLS
tara:strand:+ start:516 stop:662 length:147 start_codon:yes stop_codon:yes gene_type:complete